MKKGRVKPLMRHQCDIKATSKRVASQAVATPKPLSCDLQATLMRPSSHLHATFKPPSCDLKATLLSGSRERTSLLSCLGLLVGIGCTGIE